MSQEINEYDQSRFTSLIARGLTQDRLKELLTYDSNTGEFHRRRTGKIAGWLEDGGYAKVYVEGHTYYAHVLAWFYIYGEWTMVDHADTIKANNTLSNLRKANRRQNSANQGVRITNLLGVKGVQQRGNRFRAMITVNYRVIHLGTFDTIEKASEAYRQAAIRHSGDFANG